MIRSAFIKNAENNNFYVEKQNYKVLIFSEWCLNFLQLYSTLLQISQKMYFINLCVHIYKNYCIWCKGWRWLKVDSINFMANLTVLKDGI